MAYLLSCPFPHHYFFSFLSIVGRSVVKTESCKAVLAHSAITSTLAAAVPGLQATPKGATVSSAECPSLKYVIHDGIDPVAGMLNLRNILCYNSSAAVSSSGSGNVIGVSFVCFCVVDVLLPISHCCCLQYRASPTRRSLLVQLPLRTK